MRKSTKQLHGFSIRLKQSREACSYTQKQLADISNVNQRSIERFESFKEGDNPSPLVGNILQLAQALDVTPEYLWFGEDKKDIYMKQIEEELKQLTVKEIRFYHKQQLTDKALSHLKLTESFIDEIWNFWKEHTLSCYRPYVQDTIIRYCHNRPKGKDKL